MKYVSSYGHLTTSELHLIAAAPGTSADERRNILDEVARRTVTEPSDATPRQRVVITGVDIPFRGWVNILVMIALAAIPAIIILGFLWFVAGALLVGVFSANR